MSIFSQGVSLSAFLGIGILAVVAANAAMAALAIVLRARSTGNFTSLPLARVAEMPLPFFSVHVPAHDEPPGLLIATLNALAAVDYPAFEVILMDNNTPDAAVWEPVRAHCERLGPQFRFVHRDGVVGAKAGALNLALAMADQRTTHVAIVDADYCVAPEFLACAARALANHQADYLQFPQAYLHGPSAQPVATELGDYFRGHAMAANASGSMLLTGTLSVIALDWLKAVGGWPAGTITEDADLGLALYTQGARGVFLNQVVGRGLLPLDFEGLVIQRHRWVAGNMQTLARNVRDLTGGNGVSGLVSVVAQLLAWPQFAAFPVLALLASAGMRQANGFAAPWALVEAVSAGTIFIIMLAMLLEQLVVRRQPEALVVKLALLWTSSLAWLPLLWGQKPTFRRTPKGDRATPALPMPMLLGGGLLMAGAAMLMNQAPLSALALLVPLLSLPAAALVDRALSAPEGTSQPCNA